MNAVSRGKLGNLLQKKSISNVLKQEDVPNSSATNGSNLSHQPSTPEANSREASVAKHLHKHEQESSDSDSDASSVGDHLVDPSAIDLDEAFFSQTLQSKAIGTDEDIDVNALGASSGQSDTEDENAEAFHENDRMYQIFTQISDYDRMMKEVTVCNESVERRRNEMALFQRTQAYAELDVSFMLTQAEDIQEVSPCAVDNLDWVNVADQNAQAQGFNNIEIIVSGGKQKTTRVLSAAERLKRLEQENARKLFLATHKTHLLLLIAYGIRINQSVNHSMIQCASELYELIGTSDITMSETVSLEFIQSVTVHYNTVMKLAITGPRIIKQRNAFKQQLASREVTSRKMLNIILLALFRFLSVRARLVMNLDVVPKYPPVVKPTPKEKCQHDPPKVRVGASRYGNVPLTTTEILKRKPEIQKVFQLSQLDGVDDGLIPNKKARVNITP
uniref:Uncharacterized protein n=1 Tax=Anopheles maculatus TaxID=74869 RepID=A0A182SI69_9DIPT